MACQKHSKSTKSCQTDGRNIFHSVYLPLKLNVNNEQGLYCKDERGKLQQLACWFCSSVSFCDKIKPLDEFHSRNVPYRIQLIGFTKLR